jgi:uncharacterized Zn-binding protein involved in type VI secretion
MPGFPAAREGDPTTHDLLVPSGVIIPPLVPCPPNLGPVLIEGLPAAHVGCQCLCSGAITMGVAHPPPVPPAPPPPILTGSMTVLIHGKPAARWAPSGDAGACGVFLGDPKLTATRTVFIGGAVSGPSGAGTRPSGGTSAGPSSGASGAPAASTVAPRSGPKHETTKPMQRSFVGESLPGNKVWPGKQVKYLNAEERAAYKLEFRNGKVYDARGNPFDTSDAETHFSGQGAAIFVMDSEGNFYASKFQSPGAFHHSSLLAGAPVAAAGEMTVTNGEIAVLTRKSGHYRPSEGMQNQAVSELNDKGIDTARIDVQGGF